MLKVISGIGMMVAGGALVGVGFIPGGGGPFTIVLGATLIVGGARIGSSGTQELAKKEELDNDGDIGSPADQHLDWSVI